MNSDQIAEGIITAAMILAICFAVFTFMSRNEWLLYVGLALLVLGSVVFGIIIAVRDALRKTYARLRGWGWRGTALRMLARFAALACGAGLIAAAIGLLWLTGPDKDSSPAMILSGGAAAAAGAAIVRWCDRRTRAI